MKIFRTTNYFWRLVHYLMHFAMCIFILLLSTGANAYEWSNDYGIYTTIERDDNFRLTEKDPIETTSTSLQLVGELRGVGEISNFRAGIGASETDHSESSIEDTENYHFFFETKRRGERWLGELDLSFNLEPTTQTELLDTGNRTDGEREAVSISPSVSYQMDETKSIFADLLFNDVSYDTVSLTGYYNNSLAIGWVNNYRENREISINGSVSEFEPEGGSSTTVSSVNFGYGFNTSEATNYNLIIGYSSTDRPTGTESDGNSSVDLQHRLDERNAFSLFLGNGYEESGAGEVRYQSRLSLRWDHALAERMQFNLAAQGVVTDDRDYLELVAGGSYQISREMSLAASYRYRTQHSDTEDSDSNSIIFSLSYSRASEWRHTL